MYRCLWLHWNVNPKPCETSPRGSLPFLSTIPGVSKIPSVIIRIPTINPEHRSSPIMPCCLHGRPGSIADTLIMWFNLLPKKVSISCIRERSRMLLRICATLLSQRKAPVSRSRPSWIRNTRWPVTSPRPSPWSPSHNSRMPCITRGSYAENASLHPKTNTILHPCLGTAPRWWRCPYPWRSSKQPRQRLAIRYKTTAKDCNTL